jgi:DNA primase
MKRLDVDSLKSAIRPTEFYMLELAGMPNPKQVRWNNGGLCPFHDDRKPNSFYVNVDTGAFKCFSCGSSGGDIISFIQLRHGLLFCEALQKLAKEWGY